MAAEYRQFAVPHDLERAVGSPMSIRVVRDLAATVNGAKRYGLVGKVLMHMSVAGTKSADATTSDRVVLCFCPRIIPRGFTDLRWAASHRRTAGSGSTVWTIYLLPTQYQGSPGMQLVGAYSSGQFTTSSGSCSVARGTVPIVRGVGDRVWIVVSAANSDTGTRSAIYTLDAWPVMR